VLHREGRTGQALAYFHFEEDPGRRSAAKLLTRDEARMAANLAKLPGLLRDIEPARRLPLTRSNLRVFGASTYALRASADLRPAEAREESVGGSAGRPSATAKVAGRTAVKARWALAPLGGKGHETAP
jgi:hypothetical protein